jgi:hypothetical protein
VVLAAQLGALAAIDAGLLDADPGFAQEAGDRVALDAELGHPPGVDHVGGGEQDAHLAAHRQHHFVIHLEQVVFALGRLALDLLAGVDRVLTKLMPESGYSYFHFHCRPVTLSTMSALVRVSSISITAWKAGMPISTKSMKSRIAKGTSTQNHCSAPVAR